MARTPRPIVDSPDPLRWVLIGVMVLASMLNYLDRQLLAAVAPTIKLEFGLSNREYGMILSAFSITYMVVAPIAGIVIDRIGQRVGILAAVAMWSIAGAATSLVQSFRGLFTCRMALGMAEAAGIPSASKATATYLEPEELSFGDAFHAVGISIGSIGAPLLVAAVAPGYGWRGAFLFAGLLGLLWLPIWWIVSRQVRARVPAEKETPLGIGKVLKDTRLWGITLASVMVMPVYSLWTNWTTVFLVQEHQLTQLAANREFAWIPPIFATLGGLFGGWLAYRWIKRGIRALSARKRVCSIAAPLLLVTAAVPMLPNPSVAAGAISLSFFLCMTLLTNLHVIPIDLFGAKRAALTASVLTSSYALMQTVLSPIIGEMVDRYGFGPVCFAVSLSPLLGLMVLRLFVHERFMETGNT